VFALNAVSFGLFALALWRWNRPENGDARVPERFGAAVRAGGRYAANSLVVRRALLRVALFVVPASALWALLPLVASRQLGLAASGYGVLLGAMGVGAVLGALVLPRLRRSMSLNAMLAWSGLSFGLALIVVALVRLEIIVLLVLLVAGLSWIAVMSSISAMLQLFLPGWVRARGLSIFQITFAAGLSLGSLFWGALAQASTLEISQLAAAGLSLVSAATVKLWPLRDVSAHNRAPVYLPEPQLVHEPDPHGGPVLITVTYPVVPENEREFVEAMQKVRRLRSGLACHPVGLFREGERAHRFVEVYQVGSWDEHLRQHSGRLTRRGSGDPGAPPR
jgi:hypothetical protein